MKVAKVGNTQCSMVRVVPNDGCERSNQSMPVAVNPAAMTIMNALKLSGYEK